MRAWKIFGICWNISESKRRDEWQRREIASSWYRTYQRIDRRVWWLTALYTADTQNGKQRLNSCSSCFDCLCHRRRGRFHGAATLETTWVRIKEEAAWQEISDLQNCSFKSFRNGRRAIVFHLSQRENVFLTSWVTWASLKVDGKVPVERKELMVT